MGTHSGTARIDLLPPVPLSICKLSGVLSHVGRSDVSVVMICVVTCTASSYYYRFVWVTSCFAESSRVLLSRELSLPALQRVVMSSFPDSAHFLLSTLRGHVLLSAEWPVRAPNAIYGCFGCHSPHSSLPLLLSCSVKQDVFGLIEHSSEQRITITTTAVALPSLQGSG